MNFVQKGNVPVEELTDGVCFFLFQTVFNLETCLKMEKLSEFFLKGLPIHSDGSSRLSNFIGNMTTFCYGNVISSQSKQV